ncbi:hypothetical protein [Anaerovibrio lipolyticus]|uniref:hypothetical protein n=1 Tax=Anaerovibrio lipolyticus TaxID=82374 RepID=UPI0023F57FA9|nr:hypothetical protein [Anaerovibrio lipolyticus]
MKRVFFLLVGTIILNVLLYCPLTEAYSLDDIKRDYPSFDIKETVNSNGTISRSIKIFQFSSEKNIGDMENLKIVLSEYPNKTKNVAVYALYFGYEKMDISKIAINNGEYYFYPKSNHKRSAAVKNAYLEMISVDISNQYDFSIWKNAHHIQIVGSNNYIDLFPHNEEYNESMNIIYRFLFE